MIGYSLCEDIFFSPIDSGFYREECVSFLNSVKRLIPVQPFGINIKRHSSTLSNQK